MSLLSISPIDGRYASKTEPLQKYFSEFGLQKYRVQIEIEYFIELSKTGLSPLRQFNEEEQKVLRDIYEKFSLEDGTRVKDIEKTTNHDVKAIEYFIKEKIQGTSVEEYQEFIHFALTSQDINNTATPLLIQDATKEVFIPKLEELISVLFSFQKEWKSIPMLARTHGQSATPTTLGKEFAVFTMRLQKQLSKLQDFTITGKFSGATGNFNAHVVAYPDYDWFNFGKNFVENILGLEYLYPTTQIDNYDSLSEWSQIVLRINTILIDLDRDVWQYISDEYFGQKVIAGEIGSSAMPHKVNPIDFENSEGNLGISNVLLSHFSQKLPISRLQRDLTDSTVLRNVGVPMSHSYIAFQSTLKGLSKLTLNEWKIKEILNGNYQVVAEGIQNILRREGYPKPYEALKEFTRGKKIDKEMVGGFIKSLDIDERVKKELESITPENYVGIAEELAK